MKNITEIDIIGQYYTQQSPQLHLHRYNDQPKSIRTTYCNFDESDTCNHNTDTNVFETCLRRHSRTFLEVTLRRVAQTVLELRRMVGIQ